jgi:hypothetical protein
MFLPGRSLLMRVLILVQSEKYLMTLYVLAQWPGAITGQENHSVIVP